MFLVVDVRGREETLPPRTRETAGGEGGDSTVLRTWIEVAAERERLMKRAALEAVRRSE